ncbi:hypothetical protein [Streptomyces goshikiensis]|uniref:hypothetical protein n=1 Tax=Streptomyces goshikiensis TaxID=1942 RepID=UPI0022F37E5A|nr:hypothetical protein [Streptomyces goshikiensis]WBY25140.1 hypothetical protein PET44_36160 [Streptomyces goshikiensis]
MTIIATNAAPLRPAAVTDGVEDVVAEAWNVYSHVQGLAQIGVDTSVNVSRQGRIIVDLTISKAAAGLLPGLVEQLDDSALTRTPGGFAVAGTIGQGNVSLQLTVDHASITVAEAEALIAAVDTDLDDEVAADADPSTLL